MSNIQRLMEHQTPAALALLAQAGGTARSPESWAHDRMTALLLGQGTSIEALMPIARRAIKAAPGRSVEAGWLSSNQFASRISWRRQTRATAADWAALLPELDVLLVMRRDEQALLNSAGGASRWYRQTGFCDVLAIRCLYVDMETAPAESLPSGSAARAAVTGRYHMQVAVPAEGERGGWNAGLWQQQMASVYADVYGACGGAMPRTPDFWASALAHHFYREHYQFQIIGLWTAPPASAQQPTLMGYAVVGWSGWHSKRPRMDILELATRQWDSAVAGDLIRATCQLAWSKSVKQVRAVISAHDPYRGHLARTGFVDRWGYLLLAKWLHPQRFLDRLAESLPRELGDFWLQLDAPGELPLLLGRGPRSAPGNSLALRAPSPVLTRLLLGRLDVPRALEDGALLPSLPLTDAQTARLSACFPWTPWVFHMLDYI